jgi:benzodiazapine receptor
MNTVKKAWINGVFLIITLGVNALGGLGFINGLSQKEVSDKYITLIKPSSSAFSIWSVIYVLLFISIIIMIVKKDDPYYQKVIDKNTVLFIISSLFNMAWIVLFSYLQIGLSTFFILGFVIALSLICLQLLKINEEKHFLLPLTFGIYTGWVFIATVVNAAAALVKLEWNRFGLAPEVWATFILGYQLF